MGTDRDLKEHVEIWQWVFGALPRCGLGPALWDRVSGHMAMRPPQMRAIPSLGRCLISCCSFDLIGEKPWGSIFTLKPLLGSWLREQGPGGAEPRPW